MQHPEQFTACQVQTGSQQSTGNNDCPTGQKDKEKAELKVRNHSDLHLCCRPRGASDPNCSTFTPGFTLLCRTATATHCLTWESVLLFKNATDKWGSAFRACIFISCVFPEEFSLLRGFNPVWGLRTETNYATYNYQNDRITEQTTWTSLCFYSTDAISPLILTVSNLTFYYNSQILLSENS